jgi:hypothetical protein
MDITGYVKEIRDVLYSENKNVVLRLPIGSYPFRMEGCDIVYKETFEDGKPKKVEVVVTLKQELIADIAL